MSKRQVARCKTCKHWTRCTRDFDKKFHGVHSGECSSNAFEYTGDGGFTPKDGLAYWDADSYRAGFYTGENFGCVHHT